MATELFSLWGGYTGWRSQAFPGYTVTATFDGHHWYSGECDSTKKAEKSFYAAARRAFMRKILKKFGINLALGEGYCGGKG